MALPEGGAAHAPPHDPPMPRRRPAACGRLVCPRATLPHGRWRAQDHRRELRERSLCVTDPFLTTVLWLRRVCLTRLNRSATPAKGNHSHAYSPVCPSATSVPHEAVLLVVFGGRDI